MKAILCILLLGVLITGCVCEDNLVKDIVYKTDTVYIDNCTCPEVDCVKEIYDMKQEIEDMRSVLNDN